MKMLLLFPLLMLVGCTGGLSAIDGAVAGCIDVEYTGTFTKSQTEGRVLFLSETQAARIQTVQDAVDLANAFGCAQE